LSVDITIIVVDRKGAEHEISVPTDMNLNLMEVCKGFELPVEGVCGGMAMCASCQVYVLTENHFGERNDDEEAMLDEAYYVEDNSRLGCQIPITPKLDGLRVALAPEAP
jgi:ferredoxin-2, mitochondrial